MMSKEVVFIIFFLLKNEESSFLELVQKSVHTQSNIELDLEIRLNFLK